MPTTDLAEPIADLKPVEPAHPFAVYPRRLTIGTQSVLAVTIVPNSPEAVRTVSYLETHLLDSGVMRRMQETRHGFFSTGTGRTLREKEARFAALEKEAADAAAEVEKTRTEWRNAVAMDSAADVERLEKMLAKQEGNAKRLAERLPIVREELERFRQDAADELYALLLAVRVEHEREAKGIAEKALANLRAVVNDAWPVWFLATREFELCSMPTDRIRLLASMEAEPPRVIGQAKPGTLPAARPPERRPKPVAEGKEIPPFALGSCKTATLPGPLPPLGAGEGEVVQTEFGAMVKDADGYMVSVPTTPKK